MSVEPEVIEALTAVLKDLRETAPAPVPAAVLELLAPLAIRGTKLTIDLDASRTIGAPLVTVVEKPSDTEFLAPLTPRQKQVTMLVIQGKSNRQIAEEFGISIATVKDHVHAVLQRLNLPSRRAVMAASQAATRQ
ncbi:DNA-binding NarL/FixJ family response regulator [Labrenzia sp. EL_142]|nr:DNA-binding NarL/FixJ family response regulator [Labrenzia sp. EL_142]